MEMSKAQFDEVLSVNLSSVFSVSQAAAKAMAQTGGGSIINISSLNSFGARPTIANYSAAKGGVNMLTRSMALELAELGIRVNAIVPGYFLTDLTKPLAADKDFDAWIKSEVPMGRWGRPEELVGAAVFLSSEAASYMNGHMLVVDGGWLASL
jgi:gluconate 5-dehydrogenase